MQEEPATVSALNEGELRALLNEALTYKRPKDREGKSDLFKVIFDQIFNYEIFLLIGGG